MQKRRTLALIMLNCLAFPALAQPQPLPRNAAGPVEPQPDAASSLTAAHLERMCSPKGAMQYAFGEASVPGSTKIEQLIAKGFAMPTSFAPFARAQPMSTEWSNRLFQMTYTFRPTDDAAARAFMLAIGTILVQDGGWTQVERDFDNTPMSMINAVGWLSFEKASEADGAPTRVFLALDHSLGEVSLTCSREDLTKAQFGEAFGRLPAGTPRPAVPEIPVPAGLGPDRCGDEAVLAEMRSLIAEERFADTFMARMLERTTYRDRLTTWMMWKLEQSGKVDPMVLVNLTLDAVGGASPGGNPFAAMEKFIDMMPIVTRLGAAEKAEDPQALCLALVDFQGWVRDVDAITLNQTGAAHRALEAKARELGVSLD